MIKWLCAAIIALLSGCTNEQIYHGAQANQRNECDKLQLSQREECLKHLAPADYRDYERERQKLEKK
jgi:hypothetical protein